MSTVGGFFCGQPLPPKEGEDPKNIIRQYAFVWGRVLRDASDAMRKRRTVSFYVKYGEMANPSVGKPGKRGKPQHAKVGKFMKCTVSERRVGENAVASVMSAVERGDVVLCFGCLTTRYYRNKRGEEHRLFWLTVDVIVPMEAIGQLLRLCGSNGIQRLLEAEDNEAPDAWEND